MVRSEDDRKNDGQDADGRNATGNRQRQDKDVGSALRDVYRDAVSEDVPNEMLDLLDKLK